MVTAISLPPMVQTVSQAKNAGYSQSEVSKMVSSGEITCETCKNRKYQDESNEMVSFKSPAHLSPETAASAVMAHEMEHVGNAYDKAEKLSGEVVRASVSIKTATCPECGRIYVSGGETTTQIKYPEENPYGRSFKGADAAKFIGMNLDMRA